MNTLATCILLLLLASPLAHGQCTAQINGTVADSFGGMISGRLQF